MIAEPEREKIQIDPIGLSVSPGARLAYLYTSAAERTQFAAFIEAGIARRDKCVIITDEAGGGQFRKVLSELGLDVAVAEDLGSLVIITGQIDMEALPLSEAIFADARKRFRYVRFINDASWMSNQGWTSRDFLRLEVKGHLLLQHQPCTGICQYDSRLVKREQMTQILASHQYTIAGSSVEKSTDGRPLSQIVFEGLDEQLRVLTRLQDASLNLTASLDLEHTLDRVIDEALIICHADRAAISCFDEKGELRLLRHRGLSEEYLQNRRITYDDPSVAALIADWEPVILEDIDKVASHSPNYEMWKREGVRSIVTLPLVSKGEVFGVIGAGSGSARRYTHTDTDAMAILAAQASAAITNARLFEQLVDANHAKDEFLSTLSHELRTPLTPILGWMKILKRFEQLDPLLSQGLDVIDRNARQQVELINDLLDLTQIISGKIELFKEPADLCALLTAVAEEIHIQASERQLEFLVHLPEQQAVYSMDPVRVRQMVANLLSNAVKFTPDGGRIDLLLRVDPGVKVDGMRPTHEIVIEVTDTGIGVEQEFLSHLFERFSQGSGGLNRRFGGLGLGLAITRALAEMHGGTVTAASPGRDLGSTFTLRLPAI
jgi:signal transduction histidine kinase